MSITFSSIPANAAASGVYVEQQNVNRGTGSAVIPRKQLIIGQYNTGFSPTDNVPIKLLNKEEAWTRYGRGSMLSKMVQLAFEENGGNDVYALPVADAGGSVANTQEIAVTGTATATGYVYLYIEGKLKQITVASGATATTVATAIKAAIDADLDLPVTAGTVTTATFDLTTRWKGESGQQIDVSLNLDGESLPAGITIVITDNADGAGDPVLTTALSNCLNIWFTDIVNPYITEANIAALETYWATCDDGTVMKQFAGFVGNTMTVSNFVTALSSRNSQATTFIPVPGSVTPEYMLAAAGASLFCKENSLTPGRPVKNLVIPGAIAGNEDMGNDKDAIVRAGGSWTINQDSGLVTIGDLCTTRTTEDSGAETSDWRFTDIISNIQFKIYATQQRFLQSPYDRGVVLSDADGKGPAWGVRPSTVKGAAIALVDDWIGRGLSTDRESIVAGIASTINSSNPGRIDLLIPDIASAGLRISANKIEWSFLVGGN